jgi:hypothetical protein
MKPNMLTKIVFCASMVLLLVGCVTQHLGLVVADTDKPVKIIRTDDFILTARFMDDETLRAKFGKETNPFVSDYYSLQFRRFMVFEVSIENTGSEAVKFQLNALELHYEGSNMSAYNEFRINQYWAFKDEQGEVKAGDKTRRERFVKNNVLPAAATIPAQGELEGFAVFTGNTPNYGSAILYVPIFSLAGRPVHRFEVPFEF